MLQAIIGALCGVGLFFVLADVYRIPYLKTSKAVESLSKKQKVKTSTLNVWLGNLADFLAKHMKLNEFKKAQLEADLKTAQMEIMNVMVVILVVAAIVLGIVVLYNLGVMSYVERHRELATLKVLGFRDKHIGKLLIAQNTWLTVIGVAFGIPAGIGVLHVLVTALVSEYELSLAIGISTYVFSAALTFGVSLLVGLMVARKNKKIDMVEALKGTE